MGDAVIAVANWDDRVAPVFDTARTAIIAHVRDRKITRPKLTALPDGLMDRALLLRNSRVTVLLCGALSRPLQRILSGMGIEVHAFLAGRTDELLAAWCKGHTDMTTYAMPGCGRRRNGRGQRHARHQNRHGKDFS